MPFHSIAIRIVSSYLQVAGMLLQFDLYLPPSIRTLFVVESRTSSLSEQLLLFDCGTNIRNDRDLFLLKQGASVWAIPLCSILFCVIFWSLLHGVVLRHKKKGGLTGLDGFVSSLMILFYTLFPSVVNRIALTFSCRSYGIGNNEKSLLTEALSVECYSFEHWSLIGLFGIPGISIYIVIVPTLIALQLIRQRRKQTLYPTQFNYQSKWTLRFGFMFAGYKKGYEWWEVVVMLRKCCFVLLAVFLRPYGAAPQVVAASCVLVAALSATLQNMPYQDGQHNLIEAIGIQSCILQLMVALICNLIQDKQGNSYGDNNNNNNNSLGPKSTAFLIFIVFGSTLVFVVVTVRATIRGSLDAKGAVGKLASFLKKCCCVGSEDVQTDRGRGLPSSTVGTHIFPTRQNSLIKTVTKAVAHQKVVNIFEASEDARAAKIKQLKLSKLHASTRVQQRLAQRKRANRQEEGTTTATAAEADAVLRPRTGQE
jgi:hypothetical protein